MNRIRIVMLAALLTGCAAAPQQQEAPAASVATVEPVVTHVSMVAAEPPQIEPEAELPTPLAKVEVRPVNPEDELCLAQALYWEARGEGQDGMVAVASVIFNRVADERFPDSVCGVVYEGGESPPCQFSWWCDGKSDEPTNPKMWSKTLNLANEYLAIQPYDPTDGALFYHATYIQSPWRRQQTAHIGNHIFYR